MATTTIPASPSRHITVHPNGLGFLYRCNTCGVGFTSNGTAEVASADHAADDHGDTEAMYQQNR